MTCQWAKDFYGLSTQLSVMRLFLVLKKHQQLLPPSKHWHKSQSADVTVQLWSSTQKGQQRVWDCTTPPHTLGVCASMHKRVHESACVHRPMLQMVSGYKRRTGKAETSPPTLKKTSMAPSTHRVPAPQHKEGLTPGHTWGWATIMDTTLYV